MMHTKVLLSVLILIIVLACGCTSQNQDEAFKTLVQDVKTDFAGQGELIIKPYQGITVAELTQYRSAASSAIAAAETMTLSDSAGKARGIFVLAMNSTISAVDSLEEQGKLTSPGERVETGSVSAFFVTTQTKLEDVANMLHLEK